MLTKRGYFTFFVASFLLLFIVSSLFGQERFSLGLDFSLSQPLGKFEKNIKENPVGGGLFISYRLAQSPFILGLSLNMLYCDREKRIDWRLPIRENRFPFIHYYGTEFFIPLIPYYGAESFTTYSMYLGHLFVRLSPFRGWGQPYVEFLLGFNYFESESSTESNYYPLHYSREIERDTSDWATSFGLGAGISLRLASINASDDHSRVKLGLDMRFKYLRSGNIRYLKEINDIGSLRGSPINPTTETRTDVLTGTVSLVFWF